MLEKATTMNGRSGPMERYKLVGQMIVRGGNLHQGRAERH